MPVEQCFSFPSPNVSGNHHSAFYFLEFRLVQMSVDSMDEWNHIVVFLVYLPDFTACPRGPSILSPVAGISFVIRKQMSMCVMIKFC